MRDLHGDVGEADMSPLLPRPALLGGDDPPQRFHTNPEVPFQSEFDGAEGFHVADDEVFDGRDGDAS